MHQTAFFRSGFVPTRRDILHAQISDWIGEQDKETNGSENCLGSTSSVRRPDFVEIADHGILSEELHQRTALGDISFAAAGPRIWNSLPPSIRDLTLSAGTFATLLKTYLFI